MKVRKRIYRALASFLTRRPRNSRPTQSARASFDSSWYLARNPDVAAAGIDPFQHYTQQGWVEGREAPPGYLNAAGGGNEAIHHSISCQGAGAETGSRNDAQIALTNLRAPDPAKGWVMVVSHQATRTGAPILALSIMAELRKRYNIVCLLLRHGELTPRFAENVNVLLEIMAEFSRTTENFTRIIQKCQKSHRIEYAIANTIESSDVLEALDRTGVAAVALIHEFYSYYPNQKMWSDVASLAKEVVFPAEIVKKSADAFWKCPYDQRVHVMPQGRSLLLPNAKLDLAQVERERVAGLMRPSNAGNNDFIVLGCGTVYIRKGVDLFLSVAAEIQKLNPDRRIRFAWVGGGYSPRTDISYSVYLEEQIHRTGLAATVAIIDETEAVDLAYELADLFFLSSRLDPMPNVAVDAMAKGLPVICFAEASGIAALLANDSATRLCVVPYLDVGEAARCIVRLASDPSIYNEVSHAVRRIADESFQLDQYVSMLDTLGLAAAVRIGQRDGDRDTIIADDSFDQTFFLPPDAASDSRSEAVDIYLSQAANGIAPRKPCPGFNPVVYAALGPPRDLPRTGDYFADFIRRGKPPGPWMTDVIRPSSQRVAEAARESVALHIHVHYPEIFGEIACCLGVNKTRCFLLISVNSENHAALIDSSIDSVQKSGYSVRCMPNRGRDIGAMLSGFSDILPNFSVIGHVHTKRTIYIQPPDVGERWRRFLFEHLLAGKYPMIDIILDEMAGKPDLGIVFPDDPYIVGWTANRQEAASLAIRLGLSDPLPQGIEFPVGSMFWARTAALRPLLEAGLRWQDYPEEPIGNDGTILHAIERLLPVVAQRQGYRVATTHVPSSTR